MGMRLVAMLLVSLAGCGAAAQSSGDVQILPVPERADATVAPTGDAPGECTLSWEPRRLGASVVSIPAETGSRMMAPVIAALCACTKPGSQHSIMLDFEPGKGRVAAHDSADDAALDGCLAPRLGDDMYPPFEIGSDCIDCGPKRYGVFGGPPPAPSSDSRIRMPLRVDRSAETTR